MRHRASLVAAMEGISRPAYLIARELSQNSRSGLTVRFLSKKLELPSEEIEYIVDVNNRFLFTDITKVKLVPEGLQATRRITEGLENRGDVPSLFQRVKSMSSHDFRALEERLGIDRPGTKKAAAGAMVEQWYRHPDSIVEYVATQEFSDTAKEVFDIVWQSKDGIMSVSQIRVTHGGSEYDVEQALWELFRGAALFEMFRFDAEERLVRHAGLLTEIRQWREETEHSRSGNKKLKTTRTAPKEFISRGVSFSDQVCQLVAAIAAKPARLRGDGDLFREDRRRLDEIIPEDAEPSLSTCLWVAQGVEWLGRVDNELHAGNIENLIDLDRLSRQKILFDWLMSKGDDAGVRRLFVELLDEMKPNAWYPTIPFIRRAVHLHEENEQPVLKTRGGAYTYLSPSAAANMEKLVARTLEETFLWMGVIDRAESDGDTLFRITDLGVALLTGDISDKLRKKFQKQKGEIVVQPNFEIVVPTQELDPLLTVPLDQFATRMSSGQATVYQVTKDSFTSALQEGLDGDAFVEFLVEHNREKELPSNVMMTLEDWRGGIKRVRLKTVHVLETDDPLVLADLMHRRKFKKHLQELDPHKTAAYKKISKTDLTRELEKDGFVVE